MNIKILFFFIIFFIFLNKLNSQTYNFKNYTVLDGLPQNYIYTINQDKKGYLWIGTGDGIACYNGKTLKNFNSEGDLPESFTISSMVDKKGNLWFGHYQGSVSFYNGKSFKSVNFINDIKNPVKCIFQDDNDRVWFGIQNKGLFFTNSHRNAIKPSGLKIFKNKTILDINQDKKGNLLIATNKGLFLVNPDKKALKKQFLELKNSHITGISSGFAKNRLLVLTKDIKVYQYFSDENKIKRVNIKYGHDFNNATLIKKGKNNTVWIGSTDNGITKFKYKNGKLNFVEKFDKSSGLSNNYVKSFFIDREGNAWIGTYGYGLDHHLHNIFILYNKKDGLKNENVNAIQLDKNHDIWLGDGSNLVNYKFKKNVNNYKVYIYSDKNKLPKDAINTICMGNNNNILLGYKNKGLWKFNTKTRQATPWLKEVNKQVNKINYITCQNDSILWIATPIGAYKYNIFSENLQKFNMANGLAHNHIKSIFIDSKQNIWFATKTGVSVFEQDEKEFKTYKFPDLSIGVNIYCFTEDSNGNIWVGTYGNGLFKFRDRKPVKQYSKKSGLGSDFCYTLNCDENNNLWIGHKTGVTKLNIKKGAFQIYHQRESFLNAEVNHNAVCKDAENNIWFGTNKGVIKYRPHFDKVNTVEPLTHITNLKLTYQNVDWSKYSDSLNDFGLPVNAKFSYSDNHLTFYFIGINLKNPEEIAYKYKLEGVDKKWSLKTKENYTTYSQLRPGHYTFKVKARNNDGIWNKKPTSYSFVIKTPFWQTWWFFVLLSLSVLISIIIIIRIRTNRLKKQKLVLERDKQRLQKEIKERKLTEEKLQKSEEKLKLTNEELNTLLYKASHDLKSPLTSTTGLINIAKIKVKEKNALEYFNLISSSLGKLENILKKLTHVAEMKKNSLKGVNLYFNKLLDSILNELSNKYDLSNLTVNRKYSDDLLVYSDKQILYNILFNILENSIKYQSQNDPVIELYASSDADGSIKIIVGDNGIGIPENFKNQVFDMFFRASKQSSGSGLGLYVVKNAIEKINGDIRLRSEEGKGSRFYIFIPPMQEANNNLSLSGQDEEENVHEMKPLS